MDIRWEYTILVNEHHNRAFLCIILHDCKPLHHLIDMFDAILVKYNQPTYHTVSCPSYHIPHTIDMILFPSSLLLSAASYLPHQCGFICAHRRHAAERWEDNDKDSDGKENSGGEESIFLQLLSAW